MAIDLDNSFTVPVPPEQAWDVLLDVERIAPCMPGASVTSVEGDEIQGQVKVKLGPLSLTYKGTAKFTEKDQASHTIAIEATGKETRGAGTASANVQASLKPGDAAGSTLVAIHTALNVTGRPAQFGRSLLPEVSGKLIAQFAANLEALINSDGAAGGSATGGAADAAPGGASATAETGAAAAGGASAETGAGATAASTPLAAPVTARPAPPAQQEESLNAFKFIVIPVLKRVLPVAVAGAAVAVVIRRLTRRKSS
ncbi:MAG TPA: SRPBCC family protein [Trebonia sp.]|jgi:carbon monoxide dehydrogenase subunit G